MITACRIFALGLLIEHCTLNTKQISSREITNIMSTFGCHCKSAFRFVPKPKAKRRLKQPVNMLLTKSVIVKCNNIRLR